MIPDELKKLRQWAVSAGSDDKAPRDPRTGKLASVSNPTTWGTYEEAVNSGYPLIGFVLTATDPYCIIDLDSPLDEEQAARHKAIYEATANTYAETSQSGKGVHIVCRASIPRGVRRDKVEIYSSLRYMIMTGRSMRTPAIVDYQPLISALFEQMGGNQQEQDFYEDGEEILSDARLVEMASAALNGEKFDKLCAGYWEGDYPSQSEADYALINIIAFYTRSNDQICRIFRRTALGKREKAQRDSYILRMVRKIRSGEVPLVDFSNLQPFPTPPVSEIVPQAAAKEPEKEEVGPLDFPPGLVGRIAQYIYESSSRPVAEISTAAALALSAGIVGRQFNISATGLNLYLIVLARTGVGKEEAVRGIDRILNAIRPQIPVVDTFVGPGTFASGPAVIRTLDEKPCFVSVLGEFGLTLQALSDERANPHSIILRRVLLDVYSKSGAGSVLRSSAYADKEKNTKVVFSPAVTLFGESTPETFYGGLNLSQVADGLIPRFCIMEYKGDRPQRNRSPFTAPPEDIVYSLSDLLSTVLQMQANHSIENVAMEDAAKALMDRFDRYCDEHIREGQNEGIRQLWNRAHLKALKLSGVLAAADNPHNAVVTEEMAEWAIAFARRDAEAIAKRFESGDIGEGESKQRTDLMRIIKDYEERSASELETYGVTAEMHRDRVVPHSYLQRRTVNLSAFRKHRLGAKNALKETVDSLVDEDLIVEVPRKQMQDRYSTAQKAYRIKI